MNDVICQKCSTNLSKDFRKCSEKTKQQYRCYCGITTIFYNPTKSRLTKILYILKVESKLYKIKHLTLSQKTTISEVKDLGNFYTYNSDIITIDWDPTNKSIEKLYNKVNAILLLR